MIDTKIVLANDTLARWQVSNRVLKKGEIALATTDNGVQVRMGTGADGSKFVDSKVLDISGLAVSAADVKLSDDTTVQSTVDSLKAKVGDETVATQISNALTNLVSADIPADNQFVTAVSETAGVINVTRSAILSGAIPQIPESKVDGLADSLSKIDSKSEIKIGKGTADPTHSDLVMHKVSPEEYAEALKTEIPESVLYIIETSDGHVDAFGQKIQHVAAGEISSDAATYGQLIAVSELMNSALSDIQTTGTGVLTALVKSGNAVSGTFESQSSNNALTGVLNAVTSITQNDYGKITSIDGVHVISAVTLTKDDTVAGIAARYTLNVDGSALTTTIDIPKDKVISSAYVVDVKGLKTEGDAPELTAFQVSYDGEVKKTIVKADEPDLFAAINQAYSDTASKKGGGDGKYIRVTVTSELALPVYIAVPELIDTYTGGSTTTISVDVNASTQVITAAVLSGAIDTEKIADGAITSAKFSSADTFVFDCGDAEIEII